MSPRLQFRGPARQRGAIGLMAALTLTLALAFMLLVVDIGVQTCQRLLILPPTCYNHQPGVGGSIESWSIPRLPKMPTCPRIFRAGGRQLTGDQSATVLLRLYHDQYRQQPEHHSE